MDSSSEAYTDVAAKIDAACDWLTSIGVKYSRTRVSRYKNVFDWLVTCHSNSNLKMFFDKYTFEDWVNAACEVRELLRIHDGLGGQVGDELVKRLATALDGHELFSQDLSDRSGRDFSFELMVAAKFAKAGFEVDLGNVADVRVLFGDFELFVECKRLRSTAKAQKRIKDGVKQLHKRYQTSRSPALARGILVVSISKMVNPNLGLLEAMNSAELGDMASKYTERFIYTYQRHWQELKDKRTIGACVVLDCPGVDKSNNMLMTCHEVGMNNSVHPGDKSYPVLLEVANVFQSAGRT